MLVLEAFIVFLVKVPHAKKIKTCFIIWGLGNIAFLIYSYFINALPQLAISLFVICMNIYGYIEWSKDE